MLCSHAQISAWNSQHLCVCFLALHIFSRLFWRAWETLVKQPLLAGRVPSAKSVRELDGSEEQWKILMNSMWKKKKKKKKNNPEMHCFLSQHKVGHMEINGLSDHQHIDCLFKILPKLAGTMENITPPPPPPPPRTEPTKKPWKTSPPPPPPPNRTEPTKNRTALLPKQWRS